MKAKTVYILSVFLIIQWVIVCSIAGASDKDVGNAVYFVSFAFFWAGLVLLITQTFRVIGQRKHQKR